MTIRVALRHVTEYRYDQTTVLGPQVVRLRPAPHCRTPVVTYSLNILPANHFLNWQQDPHGNFLARIVIPEGTDRFRVAVDLTADLTVINPFDFFVEAYAEEYPFQYDPALQKELRPYLECLPMGPQQEAYLAGINWSRRRTVLFLVDVNQKLWRDIRYLIRMEPGVQTPEQTLASGSGSCRDSAWLLVQLLRRAGLAARFVSGYLIQLKADVKSLDGPSGAESDFTDLHAWCEAFIPGAGWVGLDPTSGLLTGEGHLPLAATPDPMTAAPISGLVGECEVEFNFEMSVKRVHEEPRVTLPYTEEQWRTIERLGHSVDQSLIANDVRLTMGGEPTFVSIDDMEGAEWNTAAVGIAKQKLSGILIRRLQRRFAPGGLLHFGQGKWYPGEPLPRWAYACIWRSDGEPIWGRPELLADVQSRGGAKADDAREFLQRLATGLNVDHSWIRPAYEDPWKAIHQEHRLPVDIDLRRFNIDEDEDRRRLARMLERGLSQPVGYILPLNRAWWQAKAGWLSGPWPTRFEQLYLIPGDSPLGLRLPIDSLPTSRSGDIGSNYVMDPFVERAAAPSYQQIRRQIQGQVRESKSDGQTRTAHPNAIGPVITTALCIEPREGHLRVFVPPLGTLEDYLELIARVESTAERLECPVVIEGYLPPADHRIRLLKVTPDPGVIEVNVHPAHSWSELMQITTGVYEEARLSRLGTEKFQLDGKHTGTGGGNHIVMGGPTCADSPFLRRPELLRSLIGYWVNHPSLSYLFSSQFIGPTSQSPRVDEGRRDAMYELEIACQQVPRYGSVPPWLVDRLFRHLLVDITGNTHRAEVCIDKLFSPDNAQGRLGLVELRSFEMPPHPQMSLTQQLLVRALIAAFWQEPYLESLAHWETALHDRFMLPYFLVQDLEFVLGDLRRCGFDFHNDWFQPHIEFRCPKIGEVIYDGVQLELRTALEPWYVLGEEPGAGGTARYVDSSVERLQVRVRGMNPERYSLACNQYPVPLHPTGRMEEFVAGVRYRAWQPPSCLHPTIRIHTPLTFDIWDQWQNRSIGGCRYFVGHPGGLNPSVYPVNALEAECRRAARFTKLAHSDRMVGAKSAVPNREFPFTLDLRLVEKSSCSS